MKASRMLISTLKEAPNEAKIDSHILLLRAGMIKNEVAGVYNYLPMGLRVLNKIPRMPSNIVENLVKSFKSFQHILAADIPKLDEVEGIGEVRARTIKQSLKRMQEQFLFDNLMI